MATESISDEWMYNEVLDDEMPEVLCPGSSQWTLV